MRIDMSGKRYGHLTVLKKAGVYRNSDTTWLCQCDCGELTVVRGSFLRNGHTKTCGKGCIQFQTAEECIRCTIRSGRSFLIDAEDLSLVQKYRWSVSSEGYVLGIGDKGERVKLLVAFLSVYAIMSDNYLCGNLAAGLEENFDSGYKVKHFEEQLFTGYDILEFEQLFDDINVEHITTVGVDGILELAEGRSDFDMSDEDIKMYIDYHLFICEKRELLGSSSHLLYVCRKQ